MRKNCVKGILLCFVMIAGMLAFGSWEANAAPVTEVTGTMTDDLTYIAALDQPFKSPEITTDSGAPAYIDWYSSGWELADGNYIEGGVFTPGEWRYWVTVVIDHSESPEVFASDVKLRINGTEWVLDHIYDDEYEAYATFYCPKTFTVNTDGTLRFTKYMGWSVPYNIVGQEIDHIVTSAGVTGGKSPYKFKKESGPDWITVTEAGTVIGTPVTSGFNEDLVVSVTDDNAAKKEITITVGYTDTKERTPIDYIGGSSDIDDIVQEGKTPSEAAISISFPEDAVVTEKADVSWRRYDPESGAYVEMGSSETFQKGKTYKYYCFIKSSHPDEFVIIDPFVVIDSGIWNVVGYESAPEKYLIESYELYIEEELDTVTVVNVPYPVVNKPLPSVLGVEVEENALVFYDCFWCKKSGETLVPCTDTEYVKSDTEYYIDIVVGALGGSTLSDSVTATVNGYGSPRTVVKDNDAYTCRVISEIPVLNECDQYFVVTAGSLNVRKDPSVNSRRVGGLKFGDVVYGYGSTPGWVLIDYEGTMAWVNRKYIALTYSNDTAIDPEKYIVTVGALNVRSTPYNPGDNSNRIGGYTLDDEVLITGKLTDINGDEWLVTEYPGGEGSQLGFMMAKYAKSASAKIDTHSLFINISGAYPHIASVPYTDAISVGNDVDLTENDYADNGDGTYSTTFYPDDACNFETITADDVNLPDSWELSVMSVTVGDDGSITVRIGPRNPVTVTFTDENGDPNGSTVISSGGSVQRPQDPYMDGYDFVGWFSDIDLTNEFDFDAPITKDTMIYPGFVLKTVAPDLERDNPETGVFMSGLLFAICAASAAVAVSFRKREDR